MTRRRRVPLFYYPFDLAPRVTSSDPREAIFVQGSVGLGIELDDMEVEMPVVYNEDEVDRSGLVTREKLATYDYVNDTCQNVPIKVQVVEAWGLAKVSKRSERAL